MKPSFKISIPKPCHEDWSTITPKEKGRFCDSCAKTVIDFTKKNTTQIQDYLLENQHQKICGHFYRKQLDTITIEIPKATFYQKLTTQHVFFYHYYLQWEVHFLVVRIRMVKNKK